LYRTLVLDGLLGHLSSLGSGWACYQGSAPASLLQAAAYLQGNLAEGPPCPLEDPPCLLKGLPCLQVGADILADPQGASCLAQTEEDSLVVEAFPAVGKQVAYQALEVPCPLNLVACPLNLVACPWSWEAYPWN